MLSLDLTGITYDGSLVDTKTVEREIRNVLKQTCVEGNRMMKRYPPQRPTFSMIGGKGRKAYRRTGTLKKSWSYTIREMFGELQGEIGSSGNIAPYNKYVQGEEQRYFHMIHGWVSVQDLYDIIEASFADDVQAAINRAVSTQMSN